MISASLRLFWIAMLACFVTGCNTDTEFPSRPVTLICPWSAGGGTDRLARQMAVLLEGELGVPVNVVNATGGGGVTGHTRGALARPDGYTLTIGTVELNMLHHRGLSAVRPADFEPLGLLNQDSAAIFVRADSTWASLAELEQSIAAAQRPLKASGTAAGGIWHVALIGWLARQDLPTDQVTWISINGAAPSLQELMAGGIDLVSCSLPEAKALLEAGEIRCLGVMSPQRSPASPEIPTFAEQGIDWSLGSWRGLLYPKGVSPDRLARMQAAVRTVSRSDEFTRFMQQSGFHISLAEPAAFTAFLDSTDRRFGETLSTPVFAEAGNAVVGAWFFPGLLGGLALLVVVFGFQSLKGHRHLTADHNPLRKRGNRLQQIPGLRVGLPSHGTLDEDGVIQTGSAESGDDVRKGPIIGVVAGVLAFVWLSPVVGYLIATGILLFGLMLAFQAPRRTAVVVTLAAPLLLYQIFSGFLGVPLPWGWLGW